MLNLNSALKDPATPTPVNDAPALRSGSLKRHITFP